MRILFTGASSFTGMWFVQELAHAGHQITAIFPREKEAYTGLRKTRVEKVISNCNPVFNISFGSSSFLNLIKEGKWDLFCHHAADVTNYRSPEFDFAKAVENNTKNLKEVLIAFKERGCSNLVLTGSVFEQGEGKDHKVAASQNSSLKTPSGLRAVSPYGLSKGLTAEVFRYFCDIIDFKMGKFVIPNPFGPYEEGRFTSFLADSWLKGETPSVACPDYVRDNIHVSLLAKAYRAFVEKPLSPYETFRPSGYQESQGAFTRRFANAMQTRWNIPCSFDLGKQTLFPEPKVRLNTDLVEEQALGWNESDAWDALARFYRSFYE